MLVADCSQLIGRGKLNVYAFIGLCIICNTIRVHDIPDIRSNVSSFCPQTSGPRKV
jgi:hypothetical protein